MRIMTRAVKGSWGNPFLVSPGFIEGLCQHDRYMTSSGREIVVGVFFGKDGVYDAKPRPLRRETLSRGVVAIKSDALPDAAKVAVRGLDELLGGKPV